MTWPNGVRVKTVANGTSWTPSDMNAVSDQNLKLAGHRGKCVIATQEEITQVNWALMPTPDMVPGIVVPAGGLIVVQYIALWRLTNTGFEADARICLNGVPVKRPIPDGPPSSINNGHSNGVEYHLLYTLGYGLETSLSVNNSAPMSFVTTGQTIAINNNSTNQGCGATTITVDPGTYDVTIEFRNQIAGGGPQAFVKERKLWVWTMGFD